MEFITQYCNIQALKIDVPFRIETTCDDSLNNVSIPSLITQTFIENCFVHGFSNKNTPALIKLKISSEDFGLQIEISDNGEATDKISDMHQSRSNQIVEQRLKNTYPKNRLQKDFLTYGMINNSYHVIIKLPILKT
ncbi:hypothetical protein [Psychroserpens sp.]